MPIIITVYGTSKKIKIGELKLFSAVLMSVTVASAKTVDELKNETAVCLCPYERLTDYNKMIVITVEGPEGIKKVEQELKEQLFNKTKQFFPKAFPFVCTVR